MSPVVLATIIVIDTDIFCSYVSILLGTTYGELLPYKSPPNPPMRIENRMRVCRKIPCPECGLEVIEEELYGVVRLYNPYSVEKARQTPHRCLKLRATLERLNREIEESKADEPDNLEVNQF